MPAFNADDLRKSTISWVLWKVLDGLSDKVLGALASRNGSTGTGSGLSAGLLHDLKAEHLVAASRELADEGSPIVQALAMISTLGEHPTAEARRAVETHLKQLVPEQRLVLAAVVLKMDRQG